MKSWKVLAVDDDEEFLALLQAMFDREGIELITEKRGDLALARFLAERPHLVLLDSVLPGLSGPELCAHIKEAPGDSFVPILMLSAVDDVDSKLSVLRMGADDYITKPIALAELWARVQVHFRMLELLGGVLHVQQRVSERERVRTVLLTALRGQLRTLYDSRPDALLPGHDEQLRTLVSTLDRLVTLEERVFNGTAAPHAGLQRALAGLAT